MKWIMISLCLSLSLQANELTKDLKKLGKARLTVFIFKVYDAKLWAERKEATLDQKLSLKLTYLRDFEAKDIIKQSMKEFKEIGVKKENMKQWQEYLNGMFPDVKEGEVLRAHYDPKKGVAIFHNEKVEYSFRDNLEFAKDFMGIWLSPKTSEPELRAKLFGIEE